MKSIHFIWGETVAVGEFVKDDKICTMVSSMGLRWGWDTGTQMGNTAQEPEKKRKKSRARLVIFSLRLFAQSFRIRRWFRVKLNFNHGLVWLFHGKFAWSVGPLEVKYLDVILCRNMSKKNDTVMLYAKWEIEFLKYGWL